MSQHHLHMTEQLYDQYANHHFISATAEDATKQSSSIMHEQKTMKPSSTSSQSPSSSSSTTTIIPSFAHSSAIPVCDLATTTSSTLLGPVTRSQVEQAGASLHKVFPLHYPTPISQASLTSAVPCTPGTTSTLSMNDELERLLGYSRQE
jgi:hypothetical protein